MGYRAFNEKTTLSDAEESSIVTVAALEASPHDAIGCLAGALTALLATVDAIEAGQRKARHAAIRAGARVRAADGFADDEVREFVKDVLAAVRQDRAAPLYLAFFQSAPTAIIALSLAPEIEEIERWVAVLAEKSTPVELKKAWSKRWKDVVEKGRAALDERKVATAAGVETSAKGTRWIERADRARHAIDGALTSYAAEHDLPATSTTASSPAPQVHGAASAGKGRARANPPCQPDPLPNGYVQLNVLIVGIRAPSQTAHRHSKISARCRGGRL
jgi:hypothetical protein